MASLKPVAALPIAETMEKPEGPGALLEQGLVMFRRGHYTDAETSFTAAIGTGRLNDAGRALAYWHIFVSERHRGRIDHSTDALSSFVILAEEILEARRSVRYAVDSEGDFVDRFMLPERLDRARAIISATWANRALGFGRSQTLPVPIRSPAEQEYFLQLTAPCSAAADRTVSRKQLPIDAIEQVTLTCDIEGTQSSVDFYFQNP